MTGIFHGWLFAVVFWTGLSVGSAALVMIHHLTGGRWGFAIRRILEAALAPLPLMGLLFIPLFFGLDHLYPWAKEAVVAEDHILQHRKPYMNVTGFVIRALLAFGVWIVIAWRLRRLSLRQDRTTDVGPTRSLRRLSGPALVAIPLVGTLAYLDWIMSLEKHWYSSIFMMLVCVGQALSAYCVALVMMLRLKALRKIADARVLNQLGNLLLAMVLLWTYLMYGQLLIIWMGNLPHEISWYLHRVRGGWIWVMGLILVFHFAIPFLILLSRAAKKRTRMLTALAVAVFVSHALFDGWLVLPSMPGHGAVWLAFITFPVVGAVWAWRFSSSLRAAPLVVENDPRFSWNDE